MSRWVNEKPHKHIHAFTHQRAGDSLSGVKRECHMRDTSDERRVDEQMRKRIYPLTHVRINDVSDERRATRNRQIRRPGQQEAGYQYIRKSGGRGSGDQQIREHQPDNSPPQGPDTLIATS
jgi:hypothetical protein